MIPTLLKTRFWRRSSTSTSAEPQPPAYENVPVFATPASDIPFLPPEILAEIIYYAIIPTFDESRQSESPIHIKTLTSLSQTSTYFLSVVRRVCRDACNSQRCMAPCLRLHTGSERCTFEVIATWMPIAVLSGTFNLSIFNEIRKHGENRMLVNVSHMTFRAVAVAVLMWDRLLMERKLEEKYGKEVYFTQHTAVPEDLEKLLKALCYIRHIRFAYFRLGATWATCNVGLLEEAVGNIAPTKYLEVNIGSIKGWARGSGGKVIRDLWASLVPMGLPLALRILSAGLKNGARRVDLGMFMAGDVGIDKVEMRHDGSLVNFIRSKDIPDRLLKDMDGVFAQLTLGGSLDIPAGGSSSLWKTLGSYIFSPFCYSLMGARVGRLEWMGERERFTSVHFLDLAMKDP
ncbi:hypothetical protein TWF694_001337 [Orbilia ellipsospora]|uniref:F-box domain-containing protein n=1 Tax=Orbilia ellipsospora TaxID=2528407 RepID=A0AAV9XRI9_9PEZI